MKYSTILGSLIAVTVLLTPPSYAQLVTDGNTATTLTPNGSITDVTTTTTSGVNAFNSFSQFDVANGQTVNMHLPGGTDNLINIINDATPSQINGIVNSIKNNEVGGNLFLANPNGIVVGSTGVINVGSLTAVTPTQTFVDNFFDSPGNPNANSVTAILNGTVPTGNAITINGTINALESVQLDTGAVVMNGAIVNSGSSARQGVFDIQDVLNIGSATDASQIVAGAGTIDITTTGAINTASSTISGSTVDMTAGGNIGLASGTINGTTTLVSNAPAADGPAEILLGTSSANLAINGNLTATATNGNVYYCGGSVDGNVIINSGESLDRRLSVGLGRYNPLNITGDLTVNSAGNVGYVEGTVNGNVDITSPALVGLMDVAIDGNMTADAAAFGYFKGSVGGDVDVNAPLGALFGVGGLLNVVGNVTVNSSNGPVDYYLGTIDGDLTIDSGDLVEIGSVTRLSQKSLTYNGTTYDINDLPVPIPTDDNVFTVEGNTIIDGDEIHLDSAQASYFNGDVDLTGRQIDVSWLGSTNVNNITATATQHFEIENFLKATGNVTINANSLGINTGQIEAGNDITLNIDNGLILIGSRAFKAGNNLNINTGNSLYFDFMNGGSTAGNDINITTSGTFQVIGGSGLHAGNDIRLMANDYIIDTDPFLTWINAGNNVIFSRQSAGDIEISSTGMLTPQELGVVNGNIVIGNHAETNSLTNTVSVLDDINAGDNNISFNSVNGTYESSIVTTGDINIKGNSISLEYSPSSYIQGNNITIDANEYLSLRKNNIIANNQLTLNAGDIYNNGIFFTVNNLEAASLSSDFLTMNGPLNINSISDVYIGNVGIPLTGSPAILINNQPLVPTEININAPIFEYLDYLSSTGDINISVSHLFDTPSPSTLQSDSDIYISSQNLLGLATIKRISAENLTLVNDNTIFFANMLFSDGFHINNNLKVIADDVYISLTDAPTFNVGGDVIFSRQTAGDIEISSTGMLTPQELGVVNGNIVIGNHAETNSLTERIEINGNAYSYGNDIGFYAGGSITFKENAIVSSRDVSVGSDHSSAPSIGNSGTITIEAPSVYIDGGKIYSFGVNKNGTDITIDNVQRMLEDSEVIADSFGGWHSVNINGFSLPSPTPLNYYNSFIVNNGTIEVDFTAVSPGSTFNTGNIDLTGHTLLGKPVVADLYFDTFMDENWVLNGEVVTDGSIHGSHILVSNGANVQAGQNLYIANPESINIPAGIQFTANNDIYIGGGTSLTINPGATINAINGDLTINAFNVDSSGNLTAGNDIIFNNIENISLGGVSNSGHSTLIPAPGLVFSAEISGTHEAGYSIELNDFLSLTLDNATLIAGSSSIQNDNILLINADGSIDPSSNIGTSVNGNTISVDDIYGGYINIQPLQNQTNFLHGNGTLRVSGTSGNVNITNNSQYDLEINDLLSTNEGQGPIIVNGQVLSNDITTPEGIIVVDNPGLATGTINIINNTASEVQVAGNVSGNTVTINNHLSDIVKTGSLISANDIYLTANNITNYLNLNAVNSTTINTTGSAFITGTVGNLIATSGNDFWADNINANNINVVGENSVVLRGNSTITGDVSLESLNWFVSIAKINSGITSTINIGNDLNIKGKYVKLGSTYSGNTHQPLYVNVSGDSNIHSTYGNLIFGHDLEYTTSSLLDVDADAELFIQGVIKADDINLNVNNYIEQEHPNNLMQANNISIICNDIKNYFNLNASNATTINTAGNAYISGTTGVLTANTGGVFDYTNINANSVNITAGDQLRLLNGIINGSATLISNAPAYNGPAEIDLGYGSGGLSMNGNFNAKTTQGNLYYYGGSIGGNAVINTAENYSNRLSTGLGRYGPLNITGDLTVNSAGNVGYLYGSVGNNVNITAPAMVGLMDVAIGGNLTANAAAFGYFGGNIGGDVNVTAPGGVMLGAGSLMDVGGSVDVSAIAGSVGAYLGNIDGSLNVVADQVVNIGNVDEIATMTYDYGGVTYDINDLPVAIPVDNNNFSVGQNMSIETNGLVNFEGLVDGIITLEAGQNITYVEQLGDFNADSIIGGNDIDIDVLAGGAYITYISAPGVIDITAASTTIDIQEIDPTDIFLNVQEQGGSINVAQGAASNLIQLIADQIDVTFSNTQSNNALTFDVAGSGGGQAQQVAVNVISDAGATFANLNTQNATIQNTVENTAVTLENATVTNELTVKSDNIDIEQNVTVKKLEAQGSDGGEANVEIDNNAKITESNIDNRSGSGIPDERIIVFDSQGKANVVVETESNDLIVYNTENSEATVIENSSRTVRNDIAQADKTASQEDQKQGQEVNSEAEGNVSVNKLQASSSVDNSAITNMLQLIEEAINVYNNALVQGASKEEAKQKALKKLIEAGVEAEKAKEILNSNLIASAS